MVKSATSVFWHSSDTKLCTLKAYYVTELGYTYTEYLMLKYIYSGDILIKIIINNNNDTVHLTLFGEKMRHHSQSSICL